MLSFGLTNTLANFMTMMNDILREFLDDFVIVYLDDILVYRQDMDDHLKHLKIVFDKLRENKLYTKLSKCEFAIS